MNFTNFNPGVHATLLSPQATEWPYGSGGGYGNGQDIGVGGGQPAYLNPQQPPSASSYSGFHPHHQTLYASYTNMFAPGTGSDSGGGCNGNFYTTNNPSPTTPPGQQQQQQHIGAGHEQQNPPVGYKIDFHNIVDDDEKLLNDPNNSMGSNGGGESNSQPQTQVSPKHA
jgi:hypothetical protein